MRIHTSFWLFLIFFCELYREPSIEKLIMGGVLIFSLLVHEYGHALTALFFGARPNIVLEAFGGYAQYNSYGMTPKHQFFITLNGPLFESLLIVLPYYLLKMGTFEHLPYVNYGLYVMMRLNIMWCLLNLIPIAPLDGGYLIRFLLERKFGAKGVRASIIIGLISAAIAAPILFIQGFTFFGTLVLIFGLQNFQILRKSRSSSENPFSTYIEGALALKNNDLEKGKAILKKLLKSKDAVIKHSAIESVANLHILENESEKAYEILLNADPQFLKEGKCLLCRLAFERGNYALVAKYSQEIYVLAPTYDTALLNAKAFAQLNEPRLAGGWLETASLFGEEFAEKVKSDMADPFFNPVREQEAFRHYADKIELSPIEYNHS